MASTQKTRTLTVHWVVCPAYVQGPYTEDAAIRVSIRSNNSLCEHKEPHRVVAFGVKPAAADDTRALYVNWESAAQDLTAEGRAECAHLGVDLTDSILRTLLGTRISTDLTVAEAGWTPEAVRRAERGGETGSPAWWQALGAHDSATLTGDGRGADAAGWCRAGHDDGEVYYERWTNDGRTAHGWVCSSCRLLTQTG